MALTSQDRLELKVMLEEAVFGAETPEEAFQRFQKGVDEWDKREHCITFFSVQKVREGIKELFVMPVIFFPGLIATD